MIKGFYAAASAMVTGMQRQMVLTHNIDNLDTPGFKQILSNMDDFVTTSVTTNSQSTTNLALPAVLQSRGFNKLTRIGDLGLGVMSGDETTDFTEGAAQLPTVNWMWLYLEMDFSGFKPMQVSGTQKMAGLLKMPQVF